MLGGGGVSHQDTTPEDLKRGPKEIDRCCLCFFLSQDLPTKLVASMRVG